MRCPSPLGRRWGDLARPGDGPRGSDRADPELGPRDAIAPDGRPRRSPGPDYGRPRRSSTSGVGISATTSAWSSRPTTSGSPTSRAILPSCPTVASPRLVLPVGTKIRARQAEAIDAPFDAGPRSSCTGRRPGRAAIHDRHERRHRDRPDPRRLGTLVRLPFAEALPDGDVGVVHYAAGADGGTDVRWARLPAPLMSPRRSRSGSVQQHLADGHDTGPQGTAKPRHRHVVAE